MNWLEILICILFGIPILAILISGAIIMFLFIKYELKDLRK